MKIPAPKPERLLADKGYDADRIRHHLLSENIEPVIPPRSNRKEHIHCDFKAYKDRNQVERLFNRLKQNRRIATRYDKTKLSFEAFLTIAALKDWMKTFVYRACPDPSRCSESFVRLGRFCGGVHAAAP